MKPCNKQTVFDGSPLEAMWLRDCTTSHDHVTLIHLPRIPEGEEGYQCRKFKEIKADFFFSNFGKTNLHPKNFSEPQSRQMQRPTLRLITVKC